MNAERRLLLIFMIGELALFTAISAFSGYVIFRPGYYVDGRVAAMLTPAGLVQNIWLEPDSFLRPYYATVSTREGLGDHPALIPLVGGAVAWALYFLWTVRRGRRE